MGPASFPATLAAVARGASQLLAHRGVRPALAALVVLLAAGAVAVANVGLLHVAGSEQGGVGSLSARLPPAAAASVAQGDGDGDGARHAGATSKPAAPAPGGDEDSIRGDRDD